MYTPTSLEQLGLVVWLAFATGAAIEVLKLSDLSAFRAGNPTLSEGKTKTYRKRLMAIYLAHFVTTFIFGAGAWLAWTEAYRSEFALDHRYKDGAAPVPDALVLSSWILSIISLIMVWGIPHYVYISRWFRHRAAFLILTTLTFGAVLGATVVFFLIDWQPGALAVPLLVWLFVLFVIGWASETFFEYKSDSYNSKSTSSYNKMSN